MSCESPTETVTVRAERPLDLSAAAGVRLPVPGGGRRRVLAVLVRVRRLDTTAWGAALPVAAWSRATLAGSPAVADPGGGLESVVRLDGDTLDGHDALGVFPPATPADAAAEVRAEFLLAPVPDAGGPGG